MDEFRFIRDILRIEMAFRIFTDIFMSAWF